MYFFVSVFVCFGFGPIAFNYFKSTHMGEDKPRQKGWTDNMATSSLQVLSLYRFAMWLRRSNCDLYFFGRSYFGHNYFDVIFFRRNYGGGGPTHTDTDTDTHTRTHIHTHTHTNVNTHTHSHTHTILSLLFLILCIIVFLCFCFHVFSFQSHCVQLFQISAHVRRQTATK